MKRYHTLAYTRSGQIVSREHFTDLGKAYEAADVIDARNLYGVEVQFCGDEACANA